MEGTVVYDPKEFHGEFLPQKQALDKLGFKGVEQLKQLMAATKWNSLVNFDTFSAMRDDFFPPLAGTYKGMMYLTPDGFRLAIDVTEMENKGIY